MSYLNQTHDPRRRATAVVTVGAVHAVLAVGLLTGLSVEFRDVVQTRLIGTTVPLPPPPAPDPTPTPSPSVETSYTPQAPTPPIELTPDPGPERVEVTDDMTFAKIPDTPRVEVTQGPPPRPAFTPTGAKPRNGNWISNDDYPRRALIDEAEGLAGYRLVIGTNGRVSSCEVARTTGHRALDDATCRLIVDRARFEPATDDTGAKVVGTYVGSVRWQIPD